MIGFTAEERNVGTEEIRSELWRAQHRDHHRHGAVHCIWIPWLLEMGQRRPGQPHTEFAPGRDVG